MKVPQLPTGLEESRDAEGLYHRSVNRYLVQREHEALTTSSGSWLPAIVSDATAPSVTIVTSRGRWVRVGPLVMITGYLMTSAVSGGSGNAGIGGLPFLCDNDDGARGGLMLTHVHGFSSTTSPRVALPVAQTNRAMLWRADSADARDQLNTQVTVAECGAMSLFMQGQYFAP